MLTRPWYTKYHKHTSSCKSAYGAFAWEISHTQANINESEIHHVQDKCHIHEANDLNIVQSISIPYIFTQMRQLHICASTQITIHATVLTCHFEEHQLLDVSPKAV